MMADAPDLRAADLICRSEYLQLRRECRRVGLDADEVVRSATTHSVKADGVFYLKPSAYAPTGVALGAPPPQSRHARLLWRLTRLVADCLSLLVPYGAPTFSYVPPDWYHITIVNRTHFEVSESVAQIQSAEYHHIRDTIARSQPGRLTVQLHGLILTRSGRLLAAGFPCDDRLYRLRADLAAALPQMNVSLSKIAHIKLGHVLVPLAGAELHGFLSYLARCGEHVSARLEFQDVYTPLGRIALEGPW